MGIFVRPDRLRVNLAPATETEDILQNVAVILATRKGSCPLAREIGLLWDFLDRPMPAARALLSAEIYEAIEAQEPRAEVLGVTFQTMPPDRLIPTVEVKIRDA